LADKEVVSCLLPVSFESRYFLITGSIICLQYLHLAVQLILGGLSGFGSIDGLLDLAGVDIGLGLNCFLVLLLENLIVLHKESINFFILAGELGSKRLLMSGKIFLMSDKIFLMSVKPNSALS
jgi:hypothetical protein